MEYISISKKTTKERMIAICAFLSCMVPRYIGTFKIDIGINISLYSILVAVLWMLYAPKKRINVSYSALFYLIWFFSALLSFWRAKDINYWAYYVVYLGVSVLWMHVLLTHDNPDIFYQIENAIVFSVIIHIAIGLFEITAHRYLFEVGQFSLRYYGTTAISVFHNPNDYSTIMATFLPFVVHKLAKSEGFIKKTFYALTLGCTIFLLIKNESRFAVTSLFGISLFYIFLSTTKSRYRKAIISGYIVAIALLFLHPAVRNWGLRVIMDYSIGEGDLVRINLIKNGLYFLRKTYCFGVGAGNIKYWLVNRSIYSIGGIAYMHNWYVELLATFGVVFFILYMIFHFNVFLRLFRAFIKNASLSSLDVAFFVSWVCFSWVSMSSSTNVYSEWVWMYLVLCLAKSKMDNSMLNKGNKCYT